MRDFSERVPKPLVPVGPRPILWHMMKYYAHFGHDDFILCLGYGDRQIKEYFLEYKEWLSNDFLDFVVDRNPYKVGRYCPGSHVAVLPVEALWEARPDYVLILPWNLRDEISGQLEGIREWGGQFVVPIPTTEVW